jgi:hypothetical protein
VATTIKLIALFKITASRARNLNGPSSSGRRNSAPPSPISPPRAPMTAPAPKAGVACRNDKGAFAARAGLGSTRSLSETCARSEAMFDTDVAHLGYR